MTQRITAQQARELLAKKPTKRRSAKKKQTIRHDFFTQICRSDLGVECTKEYRFHDTRMWRFDYAIPQYKIALEVEGGVWTQGRHTRPQGFLGDIEKYNTATLMGWRVFRTTPDELISKKTIELLQGAINYRFQSE